jgi:hypothetical protein
MNTVERKSFENVDAFRQFASHVPLLYFHVFDRVPNERILLALHDCRDDEEVVLLDVAEDSGFLREAQVTVGITQDHQFISQPLSEVHGVHAWAKGTLIAFASDPGEVPELMQKARRFAFPPTA